MWQSPHPAYSAGRCRGVRFAAVNAATASRLGIPQRGQPDGAGMKKVPVTEGAGRSGIQPDAYDHVRRPATHPLRWSADRLAIPVRSTLDQGAVCWVRVPVPPGTSHPHKHIPKRLSVGPKQEDGEHPLALVEVTPVRDLPMCYRAGAAGFITRRRAGGGYPGLLDSQRAMPSRWGARAFRVVLITAHHH